MPEAERLLSSLLTKAGIRLDPGRTSEGKEADIAALEEWTYTPISLAAFCNRAFRDDPKSPVRGWSAQGPGDDLSMFPVGRQVLRGVTFDIADPRKNNGKGLVAMSGTQEIGVLPNAVKEIPVKRKFERIVFLYGAAWGAPEFKIRINYAERKTWIPGAHNPFEEIQMRPKLEVDDWYMADTYLSGGGTMPRAKLAWTGYSKASRKRNRHIGVFLYEWDNPFPEKEIDSIDIESPGRNGKGQIFLIAISGASPRKKTPVTSILPAYRQKNLRKQMEWSKYGMLIDKNGSIPAIYRISDSKRLFSAGKWLIQGQISKDGKLQHCFLDGATEKNLSAEFSGRKITLRFHSAYLDMTENIFMEETGIRFEYAITLRQDSPQGVKAVLILPFTPGSGTFENMINNNPISIHWNDATGTLSYNPTYRWHKGYYGTASSVSFTPVMTHKFSKGRTAKLNLRLTLP